MHLAVIRTHGPLFVVEETAEVIRFFSAHYPQFAKRSVGWQLSVEEVFCLEHHRQDEGTNVSASAPGVTVVFASPSAAAQYRILRETYASDCQVYVTLTHRHGYKLRHGSPFGASYIGYRDLNAHGECLFFTGLLSDLEQVRAVRIARSVGKAAVMVSAIADELDVVLTTLGTTSIAEAPHRLKKIRRKE